MKVFAKVLLALLSVLAVVALALVLVMDYGSVRANGEGGKYVSLNGYALTGIPCKTDRRLFPVGDVMVVQKVAPGSAAPGDGVLYYRQPSGIASGYVLERKDGACTVVQADGTTAQVPQEYVFARYLSRIPYMAQVVEALRSPLVIGVFVLAYIAVILLLRLARMRQRSAESTALGSVDSEIETFLD